MNLDLFNSDDASPQNNGQKIRPGVASYQAPIPYIGATPNMKPPTKTKRVSTFEDLPLSRTIFRLIGCVDGSIRCDAPDTSWISAIHEMAESVWKKHERSGIDDVFRWSPNDVYCLVQKMLKSPNGGAARHAYVSIVKGDTCCRVCSVKTGEVHADHVVPKSLGGPDHVDNFQLLCSKCNASKNNRRKY